MSRISKSRTLLLAILCTPLLCTTGANAKSPAAKTPPKISIAFSGKGNLQMTTAGTDASGPQMCVKTEQQRSHLSATSWKIDWKKIDAKSGSQTLVATSGLTGTVSSSGSNDTDLRICQSNTGGITFTGANNCKVGNFCTESVGCDGDLSPYPGFNSSLIISGSPKAYNAEIDLDRFLTSSCAAGMEIYQHWFYGNPTHIPSLHTFKLKITPDSAAKRQVLDVTRKGKFDCATPTAKEIAGGTYYGCLLFYNLKGKITITGPYHASLGKVKPWDK